MGGGFGGRDGRSAVSLSFSRWPRVVSIYTRFPLAVMVTGVVIMSIGFVLWAGGRPMLAALLCTGPAPIARLFPIAPPFS